MIREPHTPFRTTRGDPTLLARALRVVALPVVMFVTACLVALGLFPLFGGAGYAVKAVDSRLLTGKGTISIPQFPERSSIYSASGKRLATLYLDENRLYVTLNEIDVYAQKAVLDIEDHKFYEHGPIDVSSIIRAAIANIRAGKAVQGASTISQQLIKNTETGGARTFQRKFQEAQDAILLEKTYQKSQIFELYLNQAYFGYQVYGIGTAADYYFGVPASKLTLAQAALLAGMLQAPVDYDPIKHPDAAIARRDIVLGEMLKYGDITQTDYQGAIATPIKLSTKGRTANTNGREPYWTAYVVKEFEANPAFGKTVADRRKLLLQGGLTVDTTLSLAMQSNARKAMVQVLPHPGVRPPADPESAVVSIVPQTGAIEAMVGGTDFSKSQIDLASQGRRTAGSAFKAFTLAAALEQNVPPGRVYSSKSPLDIPECDNWHVSNAEGAGDLGYLNLWAATAGSINVVFAQLIRDIGPQSVVDAAHAMGITSPLNPFCSLTLGSSPVSPLEMTSAYSTLANLGVHCTPFAISKVLDRDRKVIYSAKPHCKQAIPGPIAAQETAMLQNVVRYGTGTAANIGRPQAGKTGTGENFDDAWFVGYIPQLATGVWVGYSKAENIYMTNVDGRRGFGGTLAAPIWHNFMLPSVQNLPVKDFPAAPPQQSGTIPNVVGLLQKDAETTLTKGNFVPIEKTVDSSEPAGTVVAQSPPGGTTAALGTGVTINISNGKAPPPPPKVKVPNVVGETQQQAMADLKAAGFSVVVQTVIVADQTQDGIVQSQSPAGGTKAPPGSAVTIVVGKFGPKP